MEDLENDVTVNYSADTTAEVSDTETEINNYETAGTEIAVQDEKENSLPEQEIADLQMKIDTLTKKLDEIAAARAKLPDFAVKTEYPYGKYDDIKKVFRKK
jgi:hypothetical protein